MQDEIQMMKVKSLKLRWAGHVICMSGTRNMHKTLAGEPLGQGPLEDQGENGEDNVKWKSLVMM